MSNRHSVEILYKWRWDIVVHFGPFSLLLFSMEKVDYMFVDVLINLIDPPALSIFLLGVF